MKRIHKVMLALAAVLGIALLALVWIVRGAMGIAEDAVDTAANTIDAAVGKPKTTNRANPQMSPADDNGALTQAAGSSGTNAPPYADNQSEKTNTPVASLPQANRDTANFGTPQDVKNNKGGAAGKAEEEDTLASAGKILGYLFGDEDADLNPADILNDSEKAEAGKDKQADAQEDPTGLAGVIPGADSPTLQKALTGKYKGKEDQIIDDALEDPRAWRLLFFLGGGM